MYDYKITLYDLANVYKQHIIQHKSATICWNDTSFIHKGILSNCFMTLKHVENGSYFETKEINTFF